MRRQTSDAAHVEPQQAGDEEVQVVREVTSIERDAQLRRDAFVLDDNLDEEDEPASREATYKRQKI